MKKELKDLLGTYGLFIILIAVSVPAIILKSHAFLSTGMVINIIGSASISTIAAIGMTVVIANGHVDMSIGEMAGVSAILSSWLMIGFGCSLEVALILTFLFAVMIGSLNGFLTAHFGLNSFVSTLGTMLVLSGLRYAPTGGKSLLMIPDSLTAIGGGETISIPNRIWFLIAVAIVFFIFLRKLKYGRRIEMIGGNIDASWIMGVRTKFYTFLPFIVSAVLGCLAGVLLVGHTGTANVTIGGLGVMMNAFLFSMLGTILRKGRPSIEGTIVAGITVTTIFFSLSVLGLPTVWKQFTRGTLFLVAVVLTVFRKR